MSLRSRLILLSSTLVLVGMLLGIAYQVTQARERVSNELQAASELAYQLVDTMLGSLESADTAERVMLLNRLQAMEAVRHLDIRLVAGDAAVPPVVPGVTDTLAPAWFVRLVQAPEVVRLRELGKNSQVLIRTNAAAEIGEVWQESRGFLVVLAIVLVMLNGILYVTIGRWLAPVTQIVDTLDHAEQGDFTGQVPAASLPELRTIVEKLNRMTNALRQSQAENARLASLSLQIQEDERRNLARELHDEMGQALSAIKAIAWSLQQRTHNPESPLRQGAEKISAIATTMSGHVRAMLGRLRPALLDELGLVAALQQMAQQWNQTHKGCECVLQVAPEFGEVPSDLQIHVYRIVQEALTNIARYAAARQALVLMQVQQDFRILISDDGNGFDPRHKRPGIGLTVMRERCQALGGHMAVATKAGEGVRITINFPRTHAGNTLSADRVPVNDDFPLNEQGAH